MRFRVWWNTEGKKRNFYVRNLKEAMVVINTLTIREMDDNSIDFNMHGLECSENGVSSWKEWRDEEGSYLSELEQEEDDDKDFDFMLNDGN